MVGLALLITETIVIAMTKGRADADIGQAGSDLAASGG